MSQLSTNHVNHSPDQESFSHKEIAVFEAIARLLRDGHQPYQLTVSQIAAAAGIGKGTAYEYFKSKEEIMQKAIQYHLLQECHQLSSLLAEPGSFKDQFFKLLTFSFELFVARAPNLWALAGSIDHAGFMAYKKALDFQRIIQRFEAEIEKIMDLGILEDKISRKTTTEYRSFVLSGVASAYVQGLAQAHAQIQTENDLNDQHQFLTAKYQAEAWTMLIKALN